MNGQDRTCDVLVLGAGPAGTAAAINLHRKNSVILCEKDHFPRFKSCAGLLEEDIYNAVKKTSPGSILNSFENIEVHMPHGKCESLPDKTVLLDRSIFDQERVNFCRNIGIITLEGYKAVAINQSIKQVTTFFQNGEIIKSRYVISASGSKNKIKGMPGLFAADRIPTLQAAIKCSRANKIQPEVVFFPGGTGYGWVFPGHKILNVGIYSMAKNGLHHRFQAFLEEHGLARIRGKGSQVLIRSQESPVGLGRILLAGDAAGLANPLTGGGLMTALYSGYAAAIAIMEEDEPDKSLTSYRKILAKYIDRPFFQKSLARYFYKNMNTFYSYSRAFQHVYQCH